MADNEIPEDLLYSEDDEWVRVDDDRIVIGITDYAQQQLGDVVFVELPEVGSNLEQGEAFGVIESVKAVSDLLAPVGGEVLEVNAILSDQPETVNEDCYGDGWILVLARENEDEIETLLDPSAYRKHVEQRSS